MIRLSFGSAFVAGMVLVAPFAAAAEPLPDLKITLGPTNVGAGLRVPSAGDGENTPETIGGSPARRIKGARAAFLYVCIDDPAYGKGPRDVYVTVEAFDEAFGQLSLQYDKDAPTPDRTTRYTPAPQSAFLTGSGTWTKFYFHLPALRLGHGQNNGADFRIAGPGIAIRSITVSVRKPAEFNGENTLDPQAERALHIDRPEGVELTFGNDATAEQAAIFKALSVTSVESYVDWAGVEPEEGHWDWSKWDKQVAILKAAKLKWVPFLIAGPAYATPLWFQNGRHSHYYRCLEHGQDSRVQSLFNAEFRPYVQRFLAAFAERYRDSGVIESVLLGTTGIFGESIYPAGQQGGWTARLTGEYHNHAGWWAGDPLAVSAFRADMQARYHTIDSLNGAWGTHYDSFAAVAPFLPEKAPSDQACADFVNWYEQSMTDWATFWVASTRKVFPKTEIYLCTGGDGLPRLGADFTAQADAIAPFGAGIRITNEASDFVHNFTLTREVATATRFYGTFCGFEPASRVTAEGVVARIYNATTSGARQLHYYIPNVLGSAAQLNKFRANIYWLTPRRPKVDVAFYLARETWALDPTSTHRCYTLSRALRPLVDHDYVTRRSVADGILCTDRFLRASAFPRECGSRPVADRVLRTYRALVLANAPVLDPSASAAIESWVRAGGILIVIDKPDEPLASRLYVNKPWRDRLFTSLHEAGDGIRAASIDKGFAVSLGTGPHMQEALEKLLRKTPTFLAGVKPLAPRASPSDQFDADSDQGVLRLLTREGRIEPPK